MTPAWRLLLRALAEPGSMARLDARGWDLVLRQAASAGVLGRLGGLVEREQLRAAVPPRIWRHMQAALTIADQQQRAVRWELSKLGAALAELPGPLLLLKGAAYAAAELPPWRGRLFSDIDLLVAKSQLDAAEAALMLDGWISSHHSSYDQRYYREWMHELPPMTHVRRKTVLDLHHNILPETARLRTRPELLLAAARPLPDDPRFHVPCDVDLVLHSATHLFHEGEWEHGLRDLVDLDALLRAASADPGFWERLLQRATVLNLGRPLFYGLRYCQRLFATPVPATVLKDCPGRPAALGAALMDRLFLPALSTAHKPSRAAGAGLAAWALYVRSHYLRMPLRLLLPHLLSKAWQRRQAEREAARTQQA